MICINAYGIAEEMAMIRHILMELSIQNEQFDYTIDIFEDVNIWNERIHNIDVLDLIICDVKNQNVISTLIALRKNFKEVQIIPIADEHIHPSVYVRPDISPCSLIWRPINAEKTRLALFQILQSMTKSEKVKSKSMQYQLKIKKIFRRKTKRHFT